MHPPPNEFCLLDFADICSTEHLDRSFCTSKDADGPVVVPTPVLTVSLKLYSGYQTVCGTLILLQECIS